ncbi:MAG TPA: universal stress protein [Lapillicoccus sp.]|nr:universal stress protein [Lapillicoccus sp.]
MSSTLRHPPVVVGVDGSHRSEAALRWAIREAATRRIPLRLVSAWNPSFDLDALGLSRQIVKAHCQAVLDDATDTVLATAPAVEVTTAGYIGPSTTALIEASRGADTVVVGSRGRRAFPAFLLGATSLEVAAHAASPVVVVREGGHSGNASGPVVVGIEGTATSTEALAFAFAYASAHGLSLTALHGYQVEYADGVFSRLAAEDSRIRLSQEERALTAEAMAGWQEKYPDVQATAITLQAHPVDALVDASTAASIVVIGGRHHGRIAGALLGSVGHGVLHGAHCPVAVVRTPSVNPRDLRP